MTSTVDSLSILNNNTEVQNST